MAAHRRIFRFDRFELDADTRLLTRDGTNVFVPDRQIDALILLVKNAGRFVSKHTIVKHAWRGVAVTDNAVVQAIKGLRDHLGSISDKTTHIESKPRRGYRFVMPVEDVSPQNRAVDIDALSEPDVAFLKAKAALESMNRPTVEKTRRVLMDILETDPHNLAATIGMAHAGFLIFEATRVDRGPQTGILLDAERYAREACGLNPKSADALSTLALIRSRAGNALEAAALARKAVSLEPEAWVHWVRLASVTWGDARLRAANHALEINDQHALGYWFAATVYVACQRFGPALEMLRAGCALQDASRRDSTNGRFSAVGLHWLQALVLAALHRDEEALAELDRERAFESSGHIYAREACANSWYATGALHLQAGRVGDAHRAFREALTRVPDHACAVAATATSGPAVSPDAGTPESADWAVACAVSLVLRDRHEDAARLLEASLRRAEPGPAGWLLPVEPILRPTAHPEAWAPALAALRARAL